MRYKVGDRIKIKSFDWYNENKDEYGNVNCHPYTFVAIMCQYCGKTLTIKSVDNFDKKYKMAEDDYYFDWTDEMIEGLVEEETYDFLKTNKHSLPKVTFNDFMDMIGNEINLPCPEGYQFVDENGNIINATKIVLEKKKNEYPKTYEECCDKINFKGGFKEILLNDDEYSLYIPFIKLKRCRDAYWKIAGDEMGLGKPWEPGDNKVFGIIRHHGKIQKYNDFVGGSTILEFPTAEMRDAFKKNFDPDIEICKELL